MSSTIVEKKANLYAKFCIVNPSGTTVASKTVKIASTTVEEEASLKSLVSFDIVLYYSQGTSETNVYYPSSSKLFASTGSWGSDKTSWTNTTVSKITRTINAYLTKDSSLDPKALCTPVSGYDNPKTQSSYLKYTFNEYSNKAYVWYTDNDAAKNRVKGYIEKSGSTSTTLSMLYANVTIPAGDTVGDYTVTLKYKATGVSAPSFTNPITQVYLPEFTEDAGKTWLTTGYHAENWIRYCECGTTKSNLATFVPGNREIEPSPIKTSTHTWNYYYWPELLANTVKWTADTNKSFSCSASLFKFYMDSTAYEDEGVPGEQTYSISVTNSSGGDVSSYFSIDYDSTTNLPIISVQANTAADIYTITATATDTVTGSYVNNIFSLTLNALDNIYNISPATDIDLIYNGTAQQLVEAFSTSNTNGYVGYSTDISVTPTDDNWKTENNFINLTATDIGTYYIWIKAAKSNIYKAIEPTYICKINIKPAFRVYNNNEWIPSKAVLVYNGSTWVQSKAILVYNGSEWVNAK